jgi:hypothetical protein
VAAHGEPDASLAAGGIALPPRLTDQRAAALAGAHHERTADVQRERAVGAAMGVDETGDALAFDIVEKALRPLEQPLTGGDR